MKKVLSILLVIALVASLTIAASAHHSVNEEGTMTTEEAVAKWAELYGEVETRTYYFQMPNGKNGPLATQEVAYDDINGHHVVAEAGDHAPTWYNDYTEGAGVYWYGGACSDHDWDEPSALWAGYKATVVDADQGIFCATVPVEVVTIIWNNGVDGGEDSTLPIYYLAAQSLNIGSEYPDPGEIDTMPEGRDEALGFDGCIWIVNPDEIVINELNQKMNCGGSWYFYYGNGCYGMYDPESPNYDGCCNPDHFDANGTHVGYVPAEQPTEAPEQPTEAPAPAFERGDYDQDGSITIMDATRVQRILAELEPMPEEAFLKAVDADGDGELNIVDATRIQNVIAELMNMDGSKPFKKD